MEEIHQYLTVWYFNQRRWGFSCPPKALQRLAGKAGAWVDVETEMARAEMVMQRQFPMNASIDAWRGAAQFRRKRR
jgi:hypothetical protein